MKSAIDAMLKAEAVRKEHGKQAEEATPVVKQDPKFIRYFDSQDPVQRAEKIQQQSVDAFESIMVETVDEVMNVCTEVMDDLNDISEACLSCEPPRFDVPSARPERVRKHSKNVHFLVSVRGSVHRVPPSPRMQPHSRFTLWTIPRHPGAKTVFSQRTAGRTAMPK